MKDGTRRYADAVVRATEHAAERAFERRNAARVAWRCGDVRGAEDHSVYAVAFFHRAGRPKERLAELRWLQAHFPRVDWMVSLAQADRRAGHDAQARRLLRRAIAHGPRATLGVMQLAVFELSLGRPPPMEVASVDQWWSKIDPASEPEVPETLFYYGEAFRHMGMVADACEAYRQAAREARARGATALEASVLEKWACLDDDPFLWADLSNSLRRSGKIKRAIEVGIIARRRARLLGGKARLKQINLALGESVPRSAEKRSPRGRSRA